MTIFFALLAFAAMLATGFVLIRGLVNMAGTAETDLQGEGPSERALKSQKLMRQRILLQGLAIALIAIVLMVASASN